MSDRPREVDLTGYILPGESSPRFTHADLPPNKGIPFALVHLADATSIRMDLDKRVFLDPVTDKAVATAAPPLAEYLLLWQSRHPTAVEELVRQVAERLSYIRRVNRVFYEHARKLERVRDIASNKDDMDNDWRDACAFTALKIIDGEIEFTDIESGDYPILEDVWLTQIKRFKAYYIWERNKTKSAEDSYDQAGHDIREKLLREPPRSLAQFEPVRHYVETNCLCSDGTLDDRKPGLNMMLSAKARRIYETRGETNKEINWFRARLYVRMFYENIIPAVTEKNKTATLAILKAFQFSKSRQNRYLIINALEAITAIKFLDKARIQAIVDDPDQYDFSLEPVADWPPDFVVPQECSEHFSYNRDDRELMYVGRMSEKQRDALAAQVTRPEYKRAIDALYQQTHLKPYREMIL